MAAYFVLDFELAHGTYRLGTWLDLLWNVALALLAAAATVFMAVARTWLTFREVSQLADTRRMARTDDLTGLPNRRHFYRPSPPSWRSAPAREWRWRSF